MAELVFMWVMDLVGIDRLMRTYGFVIYVRCTEVDCESSGSVFCPLQIDRVVRTTNRSPRPRLPRFDTSASDARVEESSRPSRAVIFVKGSSGDRCFAVRDPDPNARHRIARRFELP